jgi:hypothetical protein
LKINHHNKVHIRSSIYSLPLFFVFFPLIHSSLPSQKILATVTIFLHLFFWFIF